MAESFLGLRVFLSSTLDRELRAVDSENKKNLQNDEWRLLQLEESLSNPKHPYRHFSTGNFQVLKTDPESKGIGCRSQITEDLDSPCSETPPNKIFVSTYATCGAALHLQRANYCVMLEPARTTDGEKQAAARVNRRGQGMKPATVMLYDDRNLAESVRLSKRANHEEMLSWKDDEIPWDKFVSA
ncbi:metalloprotease [Hypoxylon texense]